MPFYHETCALKSLLWCVPQMPPAAQADEAGRRLRLCRSPGCSPAEQPGQRRASVRPTDLYQQLSDACALGQHAQRTRRGRESA